MQKRESGKKRVEGERVKGVVTALLKNSLLVGKLGPLCQIC